MELGYEHLIWRKQKVKWNVLIKRYRFKSRETTGLILVKTNIHTHQSVSKHIQTKPDKTKKERKSHQTINNIKTIKLK
jgi:hypothetical protein